MKKVIFILLLGVISIPVFSQKGNLTVGLKGGYVYSPNYYNGILYGIDAAYHLSDPFEVVFTGLINPNTPYKFKDRNTDVKQNLSVYSANLDFRLYLFHKREWAMGPALGGQYYITVNKDDNLGTQKALGFNLGWHVRANITDNLKINGGWRYTNAKTKDKTKWYIPDAPPVDMSYNLFYVGIGYTFEL